MSAAILHNQIKSLPIADKSAAIIAAGYVNSKGKANYTKFYEDVLNERKDDPRFGASDKVQMMAHYVNKYAVGTDISLLKLQWETYCEQCEIDGKYDDVDEFCEEFGIRNLGFYSDFADAIADYDSSAVMAFVDNYGITEVKHFAESYMGSYNSEAEFAEEYLSEMGDIPPYIVIDWQSTWDCGLRYDFTFDDGYVFRDNF
jgi:hypothetical protein